jgi:hypothetical protein
VSVRITVDDADTILVTEAVIALIAWWQADMDRCSRHGLCRTGSYVMVDGKAEPCPECREIDRIAGSAFRRLQDVARRLSELVKEESELSWS